MAVALEKGLIVPVISKCDELNFLGICRKVNELAQKSRKNQINPSELSGSTFTVTNFGIFVELTTDLDGLIHLSDISWEEPGEIAIKKFEVDQPVKFKILEI